MGIKEGMLFVSIGSKFDFPTIYKEDAGKKTVTAKTIYIFGGTQKKKKWIAITAANC